MAWFHRSKTIFLSTTNNNVPFNAIIRAGRNENFLLLLALAISFDQTHPLFSGHIVTNPSLRTLPTISLVNLSSFSHLFQLPQLHIFGT